MWQLCNDGPCVSKISDSYSDKDLLLDKVLSIQVSQDFDQRIGKTLLQFVLQCLRWFIFAGAKCIGCTVLLCTNNSKIEITSEMQQQ